MDNHVLTLKRSLFLPSEYSGMTVQHLMAHPALANGRQVCDVGTGGGVLGATALKLGAASVTALDIDPDALEVAEQTFAAVAPNGGWTLRQGVMWQALAQDDARFDLVLANLPNFPAELLHEPGRSAQWCVGGASGRRILDPFLLDLPSHLRPGGCAVFTQNQCVGVAQTLAQLRDAGLVAEVVGRALAPISPEKMKALSRSCAEPEGIVEIAGFAFSSVCLIVAKMEGVAVAPNL
jgi:release factor glutamine methyltransferase